MGNEVNFERSGADEVARQMALLVRPGSGYVGCTEVLVAALRLAPDALVELRSAPLGDLGQQILALRYLMQNGAIWFKYFSWRKPLEKVSPEGVALSVALMERMERTLATLAEQRKPAAFVAKLSLEQVARTVEADPTSDESLKLFAALQLDADELVALRARLNKESARLVAEAPRLLDVVYLTSQDLTRFPATTVGEGALKYLIVADKGEMGARAVREATARGLVPVVLFNEQDDSDSLARRLGDEAGGFAIGLDGNFRESYANPAKITRRIKEEYLEQFGEDATERLRQSALYPGYGPLAENTIAIAHFRKNGIVFSGPSQDSVEGAGDKRKFRRLAESVDEKAVTPGIIIDDTKADSILLRVQEGYAAGKFSFPGRLKAANGGGGRGQVVIERPEDVKGAVQKVLSDIQANGWDPGVMFEQNIFETIHLEVQVVRDRYGNTRHFGMRDCSEQRASQKIQEEAPPALLRKESRLEKKMCEVAVQIADAVDYVGACTVELMYKDGHFYLLEMNTRIQVEHPVTEEAHRIRRGKELTPLNLVQLQLDVVQGRRLDFAQDDVVQTHVAREFRINAESYKRAVKDPRDGKKGLFLPNAGVFDEIVIPEAEEVLEALKAAGHTGIEELGVRFDTGFEVGDDLVNKDPTFGKLIVSVAVKKGKEAVQYELLRQASLAVLHLMKIEGRQLTPAGKILEQPFETNISGHIEVLEADVLVAHSGGPKAKPASRVRHVGWVLEHLRQLYPEV